MNTTKFRVIYIGKGLYRCSFKYELKSGQIVPLVCFGFSHRDSINSALSLYKHLTMNLV